jgi:hypothetical protein
MSQNLLSLSFTPQDLAAADAALASLEKVFAGLIALDPTQRRRLRRMGEKSEQFCRQTMNVLSQNPQIIPPSLGYADAAGDLVALDQLRPRLQRLRKLVERGADSETALGSDLMVTSMAGYGLLKVVGRNQGLDGLRKELSRRFTRTKTAAAPAVPTQEVATPQSH